MKHGPYKPFGHGGRHHGGGLPSERARMWRAILLACSIAVVNSQARPNRVVDVVTTCDKDALTATIHMEQPFKGIIFSKDFSRECRVQGDLKEKVSLHLPSNACGVRTSPLNETAAEPDDDEDLFYSVDLVVQMDSKLQQSSDQELLIRCRLQPRAVRIVSPALEGIIQTKIRELVGQETRKIRTGRNRQGFESAAMAEQRTQLLEAARAWMELSPAATAPDPATVEVGQPTRLLIQCTLPGEHTVCSTHTAPVPATVEVGQPTRLLIQCTLPGEHTVCSTHTASVPATVEVGQPTRLLIQCTLPGEHTVCSTHTAPDPAAVEVGQPTRLLIQCTLPGEHTVCSTHTAPDPATVEVAQPTRLLIQCNLPSEHTVCSTHTTPDPASHCGGYCLQYIPHSNLISKGTRNLWFNHDCAEAASRKQAAYRAWIRGRAIKDPGVDSLKAAYNIASKACNKAYIRADAQRVARVGHELITHTTGSRSYWRLAKAVQKNFCQPSLPSLRCPDGKLAHKPQVKADLLAKLFAANSRIDDCNAPPPSLLHCGTTMPDIKIRQ
ncbi:hypothetical protein evm_004012 [Chilo suppressalis]|nr:hypothetical protein evm_004012 [Chilo suppressalis]